MGDKFSQVSVKAIQVNRPFVGLMSGQIVRNFFFTFAVEGIIRKNI